MSKIFDKYKVMKLKDIDKAEWNYKSEDIVLSEKLKKNIINNGQIENLIVAKIEGGDNRYICVNGNHRIDAMKELNLKEAVCVDLGVIPLKKAQRIAIETNETKFPVDTFKLSMLMQEIASEYSIEDLESTMPYSLDELKFFVEDAPDNSSDLTEIPDDDFDSLDNNEPAREGRKCPNCGYEL